MKCSYEMLVANRKFLMLILSFLLGYFAFVGCGESEENNNQPVIEVLSDQTLDMGNTVDVKARITDADFNEITFNITSNNIDVATVYIHSTHREGSSDNGTVVETTFTITTVGAGEATITVSATDDSGQDNAEAIPVAFTVTVNEPILCEVGDMLNPGDSCIDPGTADTFSVLDDGFGKYLFFYSGQRLSLRGNINGKLRNFVAERVEGDTWKIIEVSNP